MRAGAPEAPDAEAALEVLCRVYWYPVYAFVRRKGHARHEAQDLTQAFFCQLIATDSFRVADPEKGRFRSFLIGALKHFLANEWDRASRLKRGGGRTILSWDGLDPEERFLHEPAQELPEEKLLDREWAHAVVGEALGKLHTEALRDGTVDRFEVLKGFLNGDSCGVSYEDAAGQLGLSQSAVKSAIHRLRRRFAEVFREEVQQTVASPEDAEAEIRHLFAALSE